MNSKNILPIKDKINCTCMKCLKECSRIHKINIPEMGYGSGFDGFSTTLYLCDECYQKSNPDIWSMEEKMLDEYFSEYVHDDDMWDYIKNLPLQSQELVLNTLSTGFNADYKLNPQDWIDYKLDELPYDKCKEYGLYVPEEIKSYKERYPKCEYLYNIIWPDGSKESHCAIICREKYGGDIGLNYSTYCYKCSYFKERINLIKDIKG